MFKKLLFLCLSFFAITGLFAQTGALKGKVIDKETKEPIAFANVVVEENGNQIGGVATDFDGMYTIKPIPAGKFTVKASVVGYTPFQLNGVLIKADKIQFLDIELTTSTQQIEEIEVKEYVNPIFDKDNTTQGETVTSEQIAKMPGRSAASVATTVAGVYSEGGEIGSIRGSRSSGNVTFVDGMKVIGTSSIPQAAIAEVAVYTGGLEAKYGDVTGGVTSITTKGASNDFYGGIEIVSSQLTDKYGYNLLGVSLTGPIWKVEDKLVPGKKTAVLGYFLSAEASYVVDGSPSSIGWYKVKDDVLKQIIEDPLRSVDGGYGTNLNAEFLQKEDFEKIDVKKNDDGKSINFAGKIDISPSRNLNIVVGGTAFHSFGNNFSYYHSMFNWENFSESYYTDWRTYVRLTQKFVNAEQNEKSLIKNAYYNIQVDYEKTYGKTWDKDHKDKLFEYGYVGKFKTYKIPSYSFDLKEDSVTGLLAHLQDGYFDTLVTYTYSDINYEAANFTQRYYDMFDDNYYFRNKVLIQQYGGLLNSDLPGSVYGQWACAGALTTNYSFYDESQFRISASGSADIKDHAISFGFEFEQRSTSSYVVGSSGFWELARGLMNKHIEQLDLSKPMIHYLTDANGNYVLNDDGSLVFMDTISYPRLYSAQDQALFDIKFREHLNKPIDGLDWVDVDNYDPSEFDISYFSADELLNSGNSYVGYYGYDPYGKKLSKKPTLQDYFTDAYEYAGKSWHTRLIAPFEPNYAAGYIQDQFSFYDLIFKIGVRIDRYDANQMVLKDDYTLYEAYTAGDNDNGNLLDETRPTNIGDNYVVYVNDISNPTKVLGYRNGSTWYDAEGTEIDDPKTITTATGIAPYLVNPDVDMESDNYEVSMSFKDYEPQITVMPRVAFSFPISDEALFFAHYDILSTRPSGNNLNPANYLYMDVSTTGNNVLSNPNLKPEKTVDYEIGFQQKISNSSSIKLSAFYKEMRDMIQAITINGAYPVYKYLTYGNIDFGTVKGFTVSYDLRRTGNVSIRTSYTLQFANGTGSGPDEGINLIASGQPNLRTTIPLSYDQRHALVATVDFRFFDGKNYNGPKLFGKDILQNTGANLVIRSGSGSPYSKRSIVGNVLEGSLNGSRKPWRTSLDMTIDRDILISWGKEGHKTRQVMMNVYCEIYNVLNTKNIINVYEATGNPDDNGYLQAAANQTSINSQLDPESFRNYYSMRINSPYNYSAPRTIRLGVQFNF